MIEQEKEFIQLDKSAFKTVMEILEITKPKCIFCGVKIRKNNFGMITKDIISCKNIVCLSQAIDKFEKL